MPPVNGLAQLSMTDQTTCQWRFMAYMTCVNWERLNDKPLLLRITYMTDHSLELAETFVLSTACQYTSPCLAKRSKLLAVCAHAKHTYTVRHRFDLSYICRACTPLCALVAFAVSAVSLCMFWRATWQRCVILYQVGVGEFRDC
jgi:hypothetical protein